jgi:hypothetical protein
VLASHQGFVLGRDGFHVVVIYKGGSSLQLEGTLQLLLCNQDVPPDIRSFTCVPVSEELKYSVDSSTTMLQSLLLAALGLRQVISYTLPVQCQTLWPASSLVSS